MQITTEEQREAAWNFFLHNPADLAQSYVAWAEKLANEPGIDYGCVLDRFMIPLHPGDVMAVVARPGHGKSSFMAYMAKRTAQAIAADEGREGQIVVYVTWEQTVEEIETWFQAGRYTSSEMAWGRADLDDIRRDSVKRGRLPVWMIGKSKRHEGYKRPRMTIDYVYAAIEALAERKEYRPVLMCLDYVQLIPSDTATMGEKIGVVEDAIQRTKELAIDLGIPIIIGVQAGRKVDGYKEQIPTMGDAQWSSSIEQVADKQLALWRPIRSFSDDTWNHKGRSYAVDENLFVISILKQRFEAGYGTFAVQFKPASLEMYDYETRPQNGY